MDWFTGRPDASETNEEDLSNLLSEGHLWETVDGSQFQKAQAISVLHEMLQQIFHLFHTERSSAAWDTSLLDKLRTGLHQQLEDLDACLVQVMGEEESALGVTGPTLAVKRYFQGIHFYLKKKKDSDLAWEIVRVEIMCSFSSYSNFQGRLRSKVRDLEMILFNILSHIPMCSVILQNLISPLVLECVGLNCSKLC